MRRTVPRVPHRLFAPRMGTAFPLGAVGDADAALHNTIVAIFVCARAIYPLPFWMVVGRGGAKRMTSDCDCGINRWACDRGINGVSRNCGINCGESNRGINCVLSD